MKKPIILILLGGLIVGLIGAGGYLYFSKSAPSPDVTGVNPTPTMAQKTVTWDDPAGFTFQYPEGLTVNKHDEDKVNYAHVELTDSSHPGSLVVWVKDLPKGVTDTASWGKKAATPSSALSFDTTLGGQPAQKIMISGTPKIVMVGVVWDGVLWYVEATFSDEPYWQSVYDTVTNSFAFKPLPTQPGAASIDNVVDEEEIVE